MMNGLQSILIQQADKVLAVYQSQQESDLSVQGLKGETLKVCLTDLQLVLGLKIAERIEIFSISEAKPEFGCTIQCQSSLLPKLKNASLLPELIKSGELQLEGNIQIASRIADCLGHTRFDSEEWLSGYLGDVPAHLFCAGLKKVKSWVEFRCQQSESDVVEWLQDEVRLLPMAAELKTQSNAIDTLTYKVNQVEQRINQLRQTLNKHPGKGSA